MLIRGEINFEDTLKEGHVEFLDVEEEETSMIAMSWRIYMVRNLKSMPIPTAKFTPL